MKSVPHVVSHATVDAVLALLATINPNADRQSLKGLEDFHGLTRREGDVAGRGKAVYYTNASVISTATVVGATNEAIEAFKTQQTKLDAEVLAEEAAAIARATKRAERAAAKAAKEAAGDTTDETDPTGSEFADAIGADVMAMIDFA